MKTAPSRLGSFALAASMLLAHVAVLTLPTPQARADLKLPLVLHEDFEAGMGRWHTTDPDPAHSVWLIQQMDAGSNNASESDAAADANHVLRVTGPSKYQPPVRSPHSIALLKDTIVGDFEMTVRVQNTNPGAGPHRDLCFFWGYQDPSHFYYVHVGAQPDPHSCQIFVVDGAPRTKITSHDPEGTPWTNGWHTVKIVRRVADGTMEVYFDNMEKPRMVARDKRFTWGQVGLGTFDDNGNFDDFKLYGIQVAKGHQGEGEGEGESARLAVEIKETDAGAVITAARQPFAEYVTLSGHQPIIWPLYGPQGQRVTRGYPMADLAPHEMDDHPHHRSLWFTHGDVNGHDFWLEPRRTQTQTLIKHLGFDELSSDATGATLVARNAWLADKEKILEDRRTWKFAATPDQRWIDCEIELRAVAGEVTFGDTKEGTFSVRVAGTMKVDEKMGGTIRNDHGQVDGKTWGQPAKWVDYRGPVGDHQAGITMMSHPSNHPTECRWHVRTYGLFAANPFGKKDFPTLDHQQGPLTIPAGQSRTFRYRVYLHNGDATLAELDSVFDDFAKNP